MAALLTTSLALLLWSWGLAPTRAGSRTPKPPRAGAKGALTGGVMHSIYRHWFARPYEYMFDRSAPVLTVNGRSYGRFMAGIDGIVLYGGMTSAAARHLKLPRPRFYDLSAIEKLSGHKVHLRKSNSLRTFSRFNPRLIRWGHQNLVPAPGDLLFQHTYQRVYDGVFSRFFRLMADSYLYLHRQRVPKTEARAYLRAMKRKRFDGIAYLQKRYASELQAYAVAQDGTKFTPQMAIGFWIRRSVDGTDTELFAGLQKVMKLYDGQWWKARQKAVPAPPTKKKRRKQKLPRKKLRKPAGR